MIIILTDYSSGEKVGINFNHVSSFRECCYSGGKGTSLNMSWGTMIVRESMDVIMEMLEEKK